MWPFWFVCLLNFTLKQKKLSTLDQHVSRYVVLVVRKPKPSRSPDVVVDIVNTILDQSVNPAGKKSHRLKTAVSHILEVGSYFLLVTTIFRGRTVERHILPWKFYLNWGMHHLKRLQKNCVAGAVCCGAAMSIWFSS